MRIVYPWEGPLPTNPQEFFDEFDDLSQRVRFARHQDFVRLLRRWLSALTEAPNNISSRIAWLESLVTWDDVAQTMLKPTEGMGSGEIDWPEEREMRLSAQLALFRHLSTQDADFAWDFANQYFESTSNNIDEILHQMTDHLFDDHQSELRRYLERNLDVPPQGKDPAIPASDRVVSINHNSDAYAQVIDAAEQLKEAVNGFNQIDAEESERLVTEIDAGKTLLRSRLVRVGPLAALFVPTLKWLAAAFAGTAVGMAATSLLEALISLLPSLL